MNLFFINQTTYLEVSRPFVPLTDVEKFAFVPSLVFGPFFCCLGKGRGTMLFPLHF